MPSLFKKNAAPTETVEPEPEPVRPNAKGRPTPSRAEARAARRRGGRGTSSARARSGGRPSDPKAARRALREERRAKAAEYRAGMNSGDPSRLPARERVPERMMARDIVDQRRNLGPILLAVIVFAYFLGLVPNTGIRAVAFYLLPLCLVGIVVDTVLVARLVTRKVHEKYPNSTVRLKGYVGQRALMPARWRQPKPRPGIVVGRWLPRR